MQKKYFYLSLACADPKPLGLSPYPFHPFAPVRSTGSEDKH